MTHKDFIINDLIMQIVGKLDELADICEPYATREERMEGICNTHNMLVRGNTTDIMATLEAFAEDWEDYQPATDLISEIYEGIGMLEDYRAKEN